MNKHNSVVIGTQWGDEGKGKVVDLLAQNYDVVVRFQGGNNAGHTLVFEDNTYKLHLIPSGILYPNKICILGSGMVIDPKVLLGEMEALLSRGISLDNLYISERAHVIMPYHKKWEAIEEKMRGKAKIGTTLRGIGPCYADKVSRMGFRMDDIKNEKSFKEKLHFIGGMKQKIFQAIDDKQNLNIDEIFSEYFQYGQRLKKYMVDTISLFDELKSEKSFLFEGAQGVFLDLDYGIYPFVTSSNTIAANACNGSGISPKNIDKIIGVTKAYTSKVGSGPFPTELNDKMGEKIREKGAEFGTTTGRPRRCGWLDTSMLKFAHKINQFDFLVLTKLDILSQIQTLKICTGYTYNDEAFSNFPTNIEMIEKMIPVYETLEGWEENISKCSSFEELPLNCQKYISRIEELTQIPIAIISVGPERNQTIFRN